MEHRAQLNEKLQAVEIEKVQLIRKLKAIDVLLEGSDVRSVGSRAVSVPPLPASELGKSSLVKTRKRTVPLHAVRTSPRSSLIDAVRDVARKQLGVFDSVQLLAAIQAEFPEFQLTETKHISSPLSDLVKRGVLVLEQKRIGSKPNIYRANKPTI